MEVTNVITYISFALSIGSIVLAIINHKRLRSNCCGNVGVVSLDVENTTPLVDGPTGTK
jgi:hypothetical protein